MGYRAFLCFHISRMTYPSPWLALAHVIHKGIVSHNRTCTTTGSVHTPLSGSVAARLLLLAGVLPDKCADNTSGSAKRQS